MRRSLTSQMKMVDIRLRRDELQYKLAGGIASFQLDLRFPNVKELIRESFKEEKTEDTYFLRKIQTILKRMEKSHVVKILPKRNPMELQRYALLSFKFQDLERNVVEFAVKSQLEESLNRIDSLVPTKPRSKSPLVAYLSNPSILLSASSVAISYGVTLWTLMQHTFDTAVFAFAFSSAVVCSFLLGLVISRERQSSTGENM